MDRFINIEESENLCFLCLKPCAELCSKCNEIPYCSPDHLEVHFDSNFCAPFRVLQKPNVGRFLIATRDIEPGELILKDKPVIFGPSFESGPLCLECLAPVDGSFLCPKCDLPLCGKSCTQGKMTEIENSIDYS